MNTIKNELKEQGIEIQELPSKGIKVEGDSDYIVRAFAKELQKLIENQFVNLPNILKDTVGKIVGDITPNVLKSRVENILGERYSLIEYNKVFCRLAALNTRFKLERKKRGYNIEEVNTFVMCSQGKEFISKITSEEYEAKDNISGFQNVFKNVIDTLELNSCTEIFENLLSSIKHNKDNKELVNVSEKICETNFYKEFAKKLENSELLEKEIRSIFYFLYSQMTLVSCEKFKNLKVLFICDGSEFIRNIVEKKLKTLFNFARIDKVSSHIFEIFGCEDEYDLIITNKNINEILETPIYKISKFPLESDFMDLKYFLLKTDSNK